MIYENDVTISSRRTREAGFSLEEQSRNQTAASLWFSTVARSPLGSSHNVSIERVTLTELGATIRVTTVTHNSSLSDSVATSKFHALLSNVSTLVGALEQGLSIAAGGLVLSSVRVEYVDPDEGLVVLEGTLPPPPPPPEALVGATSSALTVLEEEEQNITAAAVATVASTVTTAVVTGVALSVATSVAGAVASATASAAASAAGGAAGGAAVGSAGGGSAGGGGAAAVPLVLGVQRFGASSGLPVEMSPMQSGVAGTMASGPLCGNLVSYPLPEEGGALTNETSRRRLWSWAHHSLGQGRRLQSRRGQPVSPAAGALMNSLLSMLVVSGTVLALTIAILLYWKKFANRRYYRQARMTTDSQKLGKAFASNGMKDKKLARFRGLPGTFVFPNAFMVSVNFFATGIVNNAVTVLAGPRDDCSDVLCVWPVYLSLALIATYLGVVFAVLWHFNKSHRADSWVPLEPPEDASSVEDPLYRLVSKIRVRACRVGRSRNIMDRPTGEFTRCQDNLKEPERTERLLAHPFALFHRTPTDALDAIKLTWLNNGSGFSWRGVFYIYMTVCTQMLLAILLGIGTAIPAGTSAANVQLGLVMGVQYGYACWVHIVKPSSDRIDSLEIGTQFTIEGTQTLALYLQRFFTDDPSVTAALRQFAFFSALAALFLPVVVAFYDAVVVQISLLCRKSRGEEFSWKSACFALIALLLTIPSIISRFAGVDASLGSGIDAMVEGGAALESVADDADELAEMSCRAADGMVIDSVAVAGSALFEGTEALESFTADMDELAASGAALGISDLTPGLAALASQFFWAAKPMPAYHEAATKLQSAMRGHCVRGKVLMDKEGGRQAAGLDVATGSRELLEERPDFAWVESELRKEAYSERHEAQLEELAVGGQRLRRATSGFSSFRVFAAANSRQRASSHRGTNNLSDQLDTRAGIVYTREAPDANDSLREAVLARRRARMSKLPSGYPPIVEYL